ncbi:MAG: hypothetical protein RLN89_01765 [Parvibaculum sp.]
MIAGTPKLVGSLIVASGGKVVGRTRLQKMVCMLGLAGFDVGFDFSYHHHGPYSEDLSFAVSDADALGLVRETQCRTDWGGWFSTFEADVIPIDSNIELARPLLGVMRDANSVVLELAVTAAFLDSCGEQDPWGEVQRRKSQKATPFRIGEAKRLYSKLKENIPDSGDFAQ